MTARDTELSDHSDLSRKLLHNLEEFIDEIGVRRCTSHLESVTTDGTVLEGKQLGQEPERFIEDNLIFPVLQTLGHSIRARPVQYAPRWGHERRVPDFSLTTVPTDQAQKTGIRLFGESKPPNKLYNAREDAREYLEKDIDFHAIVILTDGIEWELWIRHRQQELRDEHTPYREASLREALTDIKKRNIERESYYPYVSRGKIDDKGFTEFTAPAILETIQTEFGVGAAEL